MNRKVNISADTMEDLEGYPSLELSTDSEDDGSSSSSNSEEVALQDRIKSSSTLSREVLSSIARLHLRSKDEDIPTGSVLEARSTLSSPGKINFTLREKFRRMSRTQRKDLLVVNKPTSVTPLGNEVPDNSNLEDEQPQLSNRKVESSLSMPEDNSAFRMKRQARYNQRGAAVRKSTKTSNTIKLHVYDLIAKDTLMQLPWGCMCEIGKCFNEVNSALHHLGTGAYHVGVEVNGIEYAFGATSTPNRTGIFSCIPKCSPGYQYRKTIEFGDRPLIRKSWVSVPSLVDPKTMVYREVEEHADGRKVVKEMIPEYMGTDYDILRKNCCTFARDVCLRLGIEEEEIPSWFGNLAESGAITQDMAYATTEPLRRVMSSCEDGYEEVDPEVTGFEVIPKNGTTGTKKVMVVVDAKRHAVAETQMRSDELRRTSTWTY